MSAWSSMTRSRRSHSERDGKVSRSGAADLEVEPGIGFDEALVGGRAVEAHFAVGSDLGRRDHRVQKQHQLAVEAVNDRPGKHPVERKAADQEQGAIHSAAMMIIRRVSEPVRRRCALVGAASRPLNLGRRRYRGGWLVQLAGSSRL